MLGVNGWEVVLLALIAVFLLGPERLPEYAAKLAHGIRRLRVMAEGARGQLRDQLGPEYDEIDWRQYDPRQYDPRRIVREALLDPLDDAVAPVRDELGSVRSAARGRDQGSADDAPVAERGGATAASATTAAAGSAAGSSGATAAVHLSPRTGPVEFDPSRATPWDTEAT